MRKNTFLSTALVLFLSLCMNITAFASPKTAHEAVGLFQGAELSQTYDGNNLTFSFPGNQTLTDSYNALTRVWSKVFPACSPAEVSSTFSRTGDLTLHFTMNQEQLQTSIHRQDAVDRWASDAAKVIFPNGLSKRDALQTACLHLGRNYHFNADISREQLKQAQGAYYLITTGEGVCASFAKAFCALVKAIPFNPATAVVDWNCEDPIFTEPVLVQNEIHQWNAVQDTDGAWYYYDSSQIAMYGNRYGELRYCHMSVADSVRSCYHDTYMSPVYLW